MSQRHRHAALALPRREAHRTLEAVARSGLAAHRAASERSAPRLAAA